MRRFICFAMLISGAWHCAGQGWVGFISAYGGDHGYELAALIATNNAAPGPSTGSGVAQPYDGALDTTPPGVSWYIELLVAPTNQTTIDASLAGWTPVFTGTNTAIGGIQGTGPTNSVVSIGGVPVPGTTTNDVRNFAVVAWSANLGSDWNAVFSCRPNTLVSGAGDGTNAVIGSAPWTNTAAPPPNGWTNADLSSQLGPNAAGKPGGFYGISGVIPNIPLVPGRGPYADVFLYPGGEYPNLAYLSLNYYTSCSSSLGPVLTSQPASQVVPLGQTVTLAGAAQGCGSAAYQWLMNGTNLLAATNNPLVITNAQLTNAGDYQVIVTNNAGSVTSAVAMVEVGLPFAGLYNTGIDTNGNPLPGGGPDPHWPLSGSYTGAPVVLSSTNLAPSWSPDTTNSQWLGVLDSVNEPPFAAYSFNLAFDLTGIDPGTVYLWGTWWGDDDAFLLLNGSLLGEGDPNATGLPWAINAPSSLLSSGTNLLAIQLSRLDGHYDGARAEVHGMSVPPIPCGQLPVITSQPQSQVAQASQNALLSVTTAPDALPCTQSYQWLFDGGPIPSATNSVYEIPNAQAANAGYYQVIVTNWSGSVTSAVALIEVAQPFAGLFNTGIDANGNPLPGGSTDPHWTLSGTQTGAPVVFSATNMYSRWSPATTNSQWIGVHDSENEPTAVPYYFNQTFVLSGFDPNAVYLSGTWWGDDLTSVLINGHVVTNGPLDITGISWSVSGGLSGWLNPGTNTLSIEMDQADGVWDGVRVEVQAGVIQLRPCAQPPMITSQPQSQVAEAGQNAALSVTTARGTVPCLELYQWFFDAGPIPSATNSVYTITNAQESDAGSYWVIVTNYSGAATSMVATVTVQMSPQITQQPSNAVVAAGGALDLSLSAIGTPPLSYQWYDSAGAIPGATNTNYILSPAQTNNTDWYFAIVTNVYGSATSRVATVIVYVPVSISQGPTNQVVPAGGTALFNVVASGYPAPSYQWTRGGTNWLGRTSSVLIISNVHVSDLGNYAVLVTNVGSSLLSSNATLSMPPVITLAYTGATAIWGRSATLSVGAIGSAPLTYQWYDNGVAIAWATNATYSLSMVQLTNAGNYSVVVSNSYGSVTNSGQFAVSTASLSLGMCATINIGGVVGSNYVIQGSYTNSSATNAWLTLTNLTLAQNPELWVDTSANTLTAGTRYYRILPAPSSMDLGSSAALNIGGEAGYSYIVQGTYDLQDTNAWVTLADLTLQRSQQLWVDTSTNAVQSGFRYYRILPGP